MIGLDTNVLVRYVVQDDPEQSASATRLVESLDEERPGYVSLVVLAELAWVLRRAYGATRSDVARVVRSLLAAREILVQEPEAVTRAVAHATGEVDFPDALISELGAAAGCTHTVTFDVGAAGLPGMRLLTAD